MGLRNDIDELLEHFLIRARVELGLSGRTVASYRSDLLHFIAFIKKNELDPFNLSRLSIRGYLKLLNESGIKKSSFLRKMSALNKFFGFLVSVNRLEENPMIQMERPKNLISIPRFLTSEEVERFLEWLKNSDSKNSDRDYLIIELMYASGMRVSEVAGLKLAAVMDALRRSKSGESSMVLVLGKGGKERMTPIRNRTIEAIEGFIKKVHGRGISAPGGSFLFPSRSKSGHITREQVCILVKKRAMEFGMDPKSVSPHVLRHSFATNMCKKNVNLRLIQQLLGHSSISTTEIYLHNATNEVLDFVKQNHPLARKGAPIE